MEAKQILKVMVPKSTNVTFQEQQKWALRWSLNFSFKISYTFGLSIKIFFPQNINISCPCGTVIALGHPSECPSLTLQAPLQVTHPFVEEAAWFWLKGKILDFFLSLPW
jgi:hypothetical protein